MPLSSTPKGFLIMCHYLETRLSENIKTLKFPAHHFHHELGTLPCVPKSHLTSIFTKDGWRLRGTDWLAYKPIGHATEGHTADRLPMSCCSGPQTSLLESKGTSDIKGTWNTWNNRAQKWKESGNLQQLPPVLGAGDGADDVVVPLHDHRQRKGL